MMIVRRDQFELLAAARKEQLHSELATRLRLASEGDDLIAEVLETAEALDATSMNELEQLAEIVRRLRRLGDDDPVGAAIGLVLGQPRALAPRLAFIERHLFPHLPGGRGQSLL